MCLACLAGEDGAGRVVVAVGEGQQEGRLPLRVGRVGGAVRDKGGGASHVVRA